MGGRLDIEKGRHMVVKKAKTIKKFRWSLIFVFLVVNVFLIFTYKDPDLLAIDSFLVTAILFILQFFMDQNVMVKIIY